MIEVIGHESTDPDALTVVRSLAISLDAVSPATHDIEITVVPAPVVTDGDGFGFAAFYIDDGRPKMCIAGEKVDEITRDDWLADMLPSDVAHEWAHYEQWRDGRPVQERGVAVRARTLLRRAAWYRDTGECR